MLQDILPLPKTLKLIISKQAQNKRAKVITTDFGSYWFALLQVSIFCKYHRFAWVDIYISQIVQKNATHSWEYLKNISQRLISEPKTK